MKKEEVPQDTGALGRITSEVCYAKDPSGKYVTEQSRGWEVKNTALDVAWKSVEGRVEAAKQLVLAGAASPLLYYMEKALMDVSMLASYSGFWKWQVRLHLKPAGFNKLSEQKLQRYADALNITTGELKNPIL